MPVSDAVLCVYLQWQSLTVDPKQLCLTPVRRKLPITPALLMRMRLCADIDWSTPLRVVVWGTMLIAFFCLLRKDSFTVKKRTLSIHADTSAAETWFFG
jgi:hypothetical protein